MKSISFYLYAIIISLVLASCDAPKTPPVDLTRKSSSAIVVPFNILGGVKTIPVKINGVTMDMIFDTGCSGISISLHEVQTLWKNGRISDSDIRGTTYSVLANGTVEENVVILLHEVEIGGENGVVLNNVEANVVLNMDAPLLLGNIVTDEVASVEVDNNEQVIKFKLK